MSAGSGGGVTIVNMLFWKQVYGPLVGHPSARGAEDDVELNPGTSREYDGDSLGSLTRYKKVKEKKQL